MNQAIGHAFMNHARLKANHIHNAVLKTLQDRGTPSFMGPAYYQGSQMVFSPIGSAPGTSQIHPQAPADEGVIDAQPISTVASTQILSCVHQFYAHGYICTGKLYVRISSWL